MTDTATIPLIPEGEEKIGPRPKGYTPPVDMAEALDNWNRAAEAQQVQGIDFANNPEALRRILGSGSAVIPFSEGMHEGMRYNPNAQGFHVTPYGAQHFTYNRGVIHNPLDQSYMDMRAAQEAGFSPEAMRVSYDEEGNPVHPLAQASYNATSAARRRDGGGGGGGPARSMYSDLFDMMRTNAQGAFDRSSGYYAQQEQSIMDQITEMEMLKQQGVTGAAEMQTQLLNDLNALQTANLAAQGELGTQQISDREARELAMLSQLETDRGAQIDQNRTELLARLAEIEGQRMAETGKINQAGAQRMANAQSDLDKRQADMVASMIARGIDPSRVGADFADTQSGLAQQAAAQAALADRFERAESTAAMDRELAARQGFSDAEMQLANRLFDERFGVGERAAQGRDQIAMEQLTGNQALQEALMSGLGQVDLAEQQQLQAILESSMGARQDTTNKFADLNFGALDKLGTTMGDIDVSEMQNTISRREAAAAVAAQQAQAQAEQEQLMLMAENLAPYYGGDVNVAMANLVYGSGKTGGLGVDFFDPAARSKDALDLQQGQFDLQNAIDTATMEAGMIRQVGVDEFGNPQFIRVPNIEDQRLFEEYIG